MEKYDYVKTKREDVREINADQAKKAKPFLRFYSKLNVWVFKKTKGRLMKKFNGGPVCVVGMTGRKSGKWLEIPLIYLPYEDKVLIVASQGGMPNHPIWYGNIVADPNIEVIADGKTRKMLARQVDDDEKRELWPHLLSIYPDFDEYQARTDRNIPVFLCEEK